MLLSTFAIAEARRLTDAETCTQIRDSGAFRELLFLMFLLAPVISDASSMENFRS